MLDRYNVVAQTLSEIEFILFESEIILDKNVRNIFKPIEDVCYLLRYSIDEYIIVCDPRYKDMSGSEDSSNQYRELLRVIFSKKNDDIQTKINATVAEFEKLIEPYIHG